MEKSGINSTVKAMMPADKGILAMDESNPTCNKPFAKLGIPQTVEARGTMIFQSTQGWLTTSRKGGR